MLESGDMTAEGEGNDVHETGTKPEVKIVRDDEVGF